MDELPEIRHRAGTQIVHDGQVAAAQDIARESAHLTLRGVGVGPQPVFDVDAPVNDVGIGEICGQALPETCSHGSVWRPEVSSWLVRACFDTWQGIGLNDVLSISRLCRKASTLPMISSSISRSLFNPSILDHVRAQSMTTVKQGPTSGAYSNASQSDVRVSASPDTPQ